MLKNRRFRFGKAIVSDTDKTKPYWVQLNQNPEIRRIRHDHSKGPECLIYPIREKYYLTFRLWTDYTCWYTTRKGVTIADTVVHRWTRSEKRKWHNHERMNVRCTMREISKMSFEDIEDSDFQNFPHRHNASWWD